MWCNVRRSRWPCDRTTCASPLVCKLSFQDILREMQRENEDLVPRSCWNNMSLGHFSSKIIVSNSSKTSRSTSLVTVNAFEGKGGPNRLLYLGRAQKTSNLVLFLVLSVTPGGLLLPQIPTVCRLTYLDAWKIVCHQQNFWP
jgi:hypothetical protein